MRDLMAHVLAKGKNLIRKAFDADYVTFKVMFSRFRQVLENHNRAIEIIADMGDKLGGDYLFDISYTRSAYAGLYDTLTASLSSFEVLTQNKYPKLREVFDRIDNEIRLHVRDGVPEKSQTFGGADGVPEKSQTFGGAEKSQTSRLSEFVLPYTAIAGSMIDEVGGKNANLAELKNNVDLNIPEAFAITAFAYDEFMRHNKIGEAVSYLDRNSPHAEAYREIYNSILIGEVPPGLQYAIDKAVLMLREKYGDKYSIAVRSSAEAEDTELSFAGQFDTVLNVPLETSAVLEAYRRVIASLFSAKAVAYQRQSGLDVGSIKMAAACVLMVDATASGVAYSTNPNGDGSTMIINATWGLGASVVEGQTDADFYLVRKGTTPEIVTKRFGKKDSMIVSRKEGGIVTAKTPAAMTEKNSLTDVQALELARQAMQIENYFRQPQDIEWAIDRDGKIFILQARPLRIATRVNPKTQGVKRHASSAPAPESPKILMQTGGLAVQKGAGSGRVFIFKHADGLASFSKGDILVARNDSSDFIRVMPYASAIITDIGSLTSHMASLCREFKVPAFVNAGHATQVLQHGQYITVTADDEDTLTVYDGIVPEALENSLPGAASMEDIYEFRKKRFILRYISPLNLLDPLIKEFTPEGCKTMHDVLRFIHEKAVMELIDNALRGLRGHEAMKLELPIPTGIIAMDIGGGLDRTVNKSASARGSDNVTFEQIASIPLRAVLRGMMQPGAWNTDPVSLTASDFLSSMTQMPDIVSGNGSFAGSNIAVISHEYLNLSLRLGYHFNMLDCYCSETARDNHVYFRFNGGATDMVKRSRRIELLSIVLKELGFNTKSNGDLIIGRLANIRRDDLEKILDSIGRLIAFTRQLDAVLHNDGDVEHYAKNFLQGNYEL